MRRTTTDTRCDRFLLFRKKCIAQNLHDRFWTKNGDVLLYLCDFKLQQERIKYIFLSPKTSAVKRSSIYNYSLFSCFVFFSSKNMQKMCGKTCNLIQRAAKKHAKIIIFRVLFHCKPLFFINVLNVYLNTKCYFHD